MSLKRGGRQQGQQGSNGLTRVAEILLTDLLLASVIGVGILLASNHLDDSRADRESVAEDKRIVRERELEKERSSAADKRELQVGLALDQELTGLTLPGWDMSGIRLPGRDLSGANLSGTDLSNADLNGATLAEANFNEANLSKADLNWAYLNNSTFRDANLSDIVLYKGGAEGTDFGCADLSGARTYASFAGALMTNSDLTGAQFSSTLEGADLRAANLTETDFSAANLTDVDFAGAFWSPDRPPLWPDGFMPPETAGPGDAPEDPIPSPNTACYTGP